MKAAVANGSEVGVAVAHPTRERMIKIAVNAPETLWINFGAMLGDDDDLVRFQAALPLPCALDTQPGAEPTFCPRNRLNCAACSWTCRML